MSLEVHPGGARSRCPETPLRRRRLRRPRPARGRGAAAGAARGARRRLLRRQRRERRRRRRDHARSSPSGCSRPGADVITLGNHTWRRREIGAYLTRRGARRSGRRTLAPRARPRADGRAGARRHAGRRDQPDGLRSSSSRRDATRSRSSTSSSRRRARRTPVVLVDFHAEATSEKVALARWLDGRVTAVLGTHTHVQTNDARVLAGRHRRDHRRRHDRPARLGDRRQGRARDPAHAHRHAGPLRARRGRRPDRGRARRVRRRRAALRRCEPVRVDREPSRRTSTASSATSTRSRASTSQDAQRSKLAARGPSSGTGTRAASARARARAGAPRRSPRRPATSGTSGTSQIRNCGESTFPKATNATTRRRRVADEPLARRPGRARSAIQSQTSTADLRDRVNRREHRRAPCRRGSASRGSTRISRRARTAWCAASRSAAPRLSIWSGRDSWRRRCATRRPARRRGTGGRRAAATPARAPAQTSASRRPVRAASA